MTKPGPLKGKLGENVDDEYLIYAKDIRSAVEWLLDRLDSEDYLHLTTENLVKEAFEDVMNDG